MKTNLKGTNLELTPQIRDYLDKRLEHIRKFLPDEESCMVDVELGRSTNHHHTGDVCRAEININACNHTFRAVSEQQDLFLAIDSIRDEVIRELGSYNKKRISVMKRGGQKLKNLLRKFYK